MTVNTVTVKTKAYFDPSPPPSNHPKLINFKKLLVQVYPLLMLCYFPYGFRCREQDILLMET